MSSPGRFEELIEARAKTLDDIRVTIERIHYLIGLIAKQIELEQQWSNANPDSGPTKSEEVSLSVIEDWRLR
ncbi:MULTISPECIES: hypothetical protein [Trichocoleus]|uniref:Uncharacterized protein n=1 Tax=Trichocoleus desertorum GB2-A4 TaxID=2933944 RepID=A0ABV0J9R5_9CYAN|nr:hypothetical protein [Trichocoleus sp. FACHB-46]MBD1862862.1 hypothetical protein [Trichocoleus sp. FACHB-46]